MDKRGLDVRSVANYVLSVRRHFCFTTTNLEIQKIVYFAHGKFLNKYNSKLVDGYFEAWEHGPVHPLLYREFKHYGAESIEHKIKARNLITGQESVVSPPSDGEVRSHIVETVMELRHLTAWQLRQKSHAPQGPWHSVRRSAEINIAASTIIPDNVIRDRYHRHILPVGSDLMKEVDVEDHAIRPDRGCERFSSADGEEKSATSND